MRYQKDEQAAMLEKAMTLYKKDPRITTVTFYHDGFVPNLYRWPAPGYKTTITFEEGSPVLLPGNYDRKRAKGRGPSVVALSKAGGRLYSE